MAGKLQVVVGGQLGSEGKGAVAAFLAAREAADGNAFLGVRVAGPNAGHTVWGEDENGDPYEFKLRHVPVSAVANRDASLALAAGSEVDIEVLESEIQLLDSCGYNVGRRLFVDESATVIEQVHRDTEEQHALMARLGSTAKGIGAARASRVMREASTYGEVGDRGCTSVSRQIQYHLQLGGVVQIEGTQGYGLGVHTGNYPFTTSSDCRAIDFMAMAGVNPWGVNTEVWVVFRTRPIRVAGNSGVLKGETSWEELGLPEERTTVTNKVRRVGTWDPELAAEAIEANGGTDRVNGALTMLDQVFPDISGWVASDWYGQTERGQKAMESGLMREVAAYVKELEFSARCNFYLLGTSPTTMIDRTVVPNPPLYV